MVGKGFCLVYQLRALMKVITKGVGYRLGLKYTIIFAIISVQNYAYFRQAQITVNFNTE